MQTPNKKEKCLITHERLLKVLKYSSETGVFQWAQRAPGRRDIAGSIHRRDGYRTICIDGHIYLGHHLAWFYVHGAWPEGLLAHIDGDRDNNRIGNLREATLEEIQCARRYSRKAGLRGAYKRHDRWVARITINGVSEYLGSFETEEQAHDAYLEALCRRSTTAATAQPLAIRQAVDIKRLTSEQKRANRKITPQVASWALWPSILKIDPEAWRLAPANEIRKQMAAESYEAFFRRYHPSLEHGDMDAWIILQQAFDRISSGVKAPTMPKKWFGWGFLLTDA